MSFPYSYSVLGLVPGLILTIIQAVFVLYTSLVLWYGAVLYLYNDESQYVTDVSCREFCLRHPEVRDVTDIGQMLFWNSKTAWYFTAVLFLLNNTFIQGLHVLVITRYLNTMSGHTTCTVVFAVVAAIISWLSSIPRTFSGLSKMATVSAFFTLVSVILAAAFAGVEGKHGTAGYAPQASHYDKAGTFVPGGEPLILLFPASGTSFVTGLAAFLNIGYTFCGQITLPSFIAEMKDPLEFRKSLVLVTVCEVVIFSLVGAIGMSYEHQLCPY